MTWAAAAMAAFGLPPVDLHEPLHHLGAMSPPCGATQATPGWTAGRWADAGIAWTPHRKRVAITVLVMLVVVLEVRQQLRADLLTPGG
ncbi:hypothetical protein GCM10027059_28570 [Myceligenerans halotolerans]